MTARLSSPTRDCHRCRLWKPSDEFWWNGRTHKCCIGCVTEQKARQTAHRALKARHLAEYEELYGQALHGEDWG